MDIVQVIGFLIVLLALLFSFLQRLWMEYMRRKYPEQYRAKQEKQEARLKELLKTMDINVEETDEDEEDEFQDEEEVVTPPPRPVRPPAPPAREATSKTQRTLSDDFTFRSRMDQFQQKTRIEDRQLEDHIKGRGQEFGTKLVSADLQVQAPVASIPRQAPRIKRIMRGLSHKPMMIIYSEIIGPPKGLQD